MCAVANARRDVIVLSVDLADAFSTLDRAYARQQCGAYLPEARAIIDGWLPERVRHVVGGSAEAPALVEQERGLDQGCPLSPGIFSVAVRDPLASGQLTLRSLDPEGECCAYLDDTYFVGRPKAVMAGLCAWEHACNAAGLYVKPTKTQIWAPDPTTVLPPYMAQYRVASLKAVGSNLAYTPPATRWERDEPAEDRRDVPLSTFGEDGITEATVRETGEAFLANQRRYFQQLHDLRTEGLPLLHTYILLRTWTQGASIHLQRMLPLPLEWAASVDMEALACLESLLEAPGLDTLQPFLKIKDGGLGLGSASFRGPGALLAAWESGLPRTAAALQLRTAVALWEVWPALAAALRKADEGQLELSGARPDPDRWQQRMEGREGRSQREYTSMARDQAWKHYKHLCSADQLTAIEAAAGPSAGAWLDITEGAMPLADHAWRQAVLRRLNYQILPVEKPCQLRTRQGVACRQRMCLKAFHALICPVGPMMTARHDAVKAALLGWIHGQGVSALAEQIVPHWRAKDGTEARLDIVYTAGPRGTVYIDVTITCCTHANREGQPWQDVATRLLRREITKHHRYPGPGLVPFVVDTNGRWGPEAEVWLKGFLNRLHKDERGPARRLLRAKIAEALHSSIADQITLASLPSRP